MNKQNRPFIVTDPDTTNEVIIWDSRSVAVSMCTFAKDKDGDWCVLANKRGEGCPDYRGYWCVPCGYLDWGEDEKDAACRETWEECGISVDTNNVVVYDATANPELNRQNVCFRLYNILPYSVKNYRTNTDNMEEKEVADIRFIKIKDINKYEWAFGHQKYINDIFNTRVKISFIKKTILKFYNKYLYRQP